MSRAILVLQNATYMIYLPHGVTVNTGNQLTVPVNAFIINTPGKDTTFLIGRKLIDTNVEGKMIPTFEAEII